MSMQILAFLVAGKHVNVCGIYMNTCEAKGVLKRLQLSLRYGSDLRCKCR